MIDLNNKEKYAKRVGNINNDCSVLTASTLDDINQVFYAEGTTDPISTPINLSVRYVDGDDYHDLIAGASTSNFEPKTLYVISSDEINAYNTQIKNVGDPINATDGANKRYVDEQIRDIEIPGEVSLENYYEKTETSSYSQLNTEFGKYYPKTETSSYSQLNTEFGKYYPKTETSSDSELANEFESLNDKFVDVETNQEINGYKTFNDGIDIGDYITNRGHNCLGVGNQLTVGLYNFYWKGIDIDTNKQHATVYLSKTQCAYPMPFIVLNGNRKSFKFKTNKTITIGTTSTYKQLSNGFGDIWNCKKDDTRTSQNPDNWVWRSDYNQLCIDLGGLNYRNNFSGITNCLTRYMTEVFTPDETISDYFEGQNIIGQHIMLVNGDKIGIWEGGKVLTAWPGKLCVDFSGSKYEREYLNISVGTQFSDFDFDDETVMFQNMNNLSGPANTGAYSSLNVGVNNRVIRRASFAAGKELNAEHDFSFVLGRKGRNHHYCSFLWAPGSGKKGQPETWVNTVKDYCFHIGLKDTFTNLHNPNNTTSKNNYDIKVIDSNNNWKNLYEHVWNCLTSTQSLSNYIKQKFIEYSSETPTASSGYTVTVKYGAETSEQGSTVVNGFNIVSTSSGMEIDGKHTTGDIVFKNQSYIKLSDNGYVISPSSGVTKEHGIIGKLNSDVTITLNYNCFAAGTLISLVDGTTKLAEDITYDDIILVWNFDEGKLDSAKPVWIKKEEEIPFYWNTQLESGKTIKTCGPFGHRFFDLETNTWIYASDINGKTIYTLDGLEKVISSEKVKESVKFYNIITDKHINLFGNKILLGCSLENHLYPVEDMKFVKDDRPLRKFEEFENDVPKWWFDSCRYAESIADKEYLVKYCKDRLPLQV